MRTNQFPSLIGLFRAMFTLAALLLMGVGVWATVDGAAYAAEAASSEDWPTVDGRILESKVNYVWSSGSNLDGSYRPQPRPPKKVYGARIRFEYVVDGRSFDGKRISFGSVGGGESGARDLVERFPLGATVPVFYDPEDPAQAVLIAGSEGVYVFPLVGVIMTVLAIVSLLVIRRLMPKAMTTQLSMARRG